jgi:Uma2 family endonuclease
MARTPQVIAPWAEPMPGAPYPMSLEEFARWPEDGRWKYELVSGRLVRMPHASGGHGYIALRLAAALLAFVEERQLGYVLAAETGFILTQAGDAGETELAPDVAYVQAGRAPRPNSPDWFKPWRLAPDLAAEVASPDQYRPEMGEKARYYLAVGVKLVWILWPKRRQVDVWRPAYDIPADTLSGDDALDGFDVLPGFSYPLSKLFQAGSPPGA